MVTRRFMLAAPLALAVPLGARRDDPIQDSQRHHGTVLAGGGGHLPDAVFERLFELAGGARAKLVFVPTASERPPVLDDHEFGATKLAARVSRVTVLHSRSRDEADTEAFVAPLRDATAVWIGGGDQSRVTAAYLGTRCEREITAVLTRGGVVGGTSAGAACLTAVMITGGTDEPKLAEGFDWIPGTILDQHFLKRSRFNRLLAALAKHPGRVGLGIDEQTAVEVKGDQVTAHGASYAVLIAGARYQVLHAGQTAKLRG